MRSTVALGVILAFAISLLSGSAASQPTNAQQSTTQPPDVKFEIVQSPMAAKWTFRLALYRGDENRLFETQERGPAWVKSL